MKITIINEENDSKIVLDANEEILKNIKNDETLKIETSENETVITTNSINFWCIVYGHAWVNNVCTRCGATR